MSPLANPKPDGTGRLILVIAAIIALLVILVAIVAVLFSKSLSEDAAKHAARVVDVKSAERARQRQAETTRACVRGNRVRGYLLLRSREVRSTTADIAPRVFPVLNCFQTVRTGQDTPLNHQQSERYLQILKAGREPLVDNGGFVVGADQLR